MKSFSRSLVATMLLMALVAQCQASVIRLKFHIWDASGNNVVLATGTTSIAGLTIQPWGPAAGAVGTPTTIASGSVTVANSGTPSTLTASSTSCTLTEDGIGNVYVDADPESLGDSTVSLGALTTTGKTFSGSPPQADCIRESSRTLGLPAGGIPVDANGYAKTDEQAYTPSGGSATLLGSSFALPNGLVGTGTSTYAGADTSGTTTLLSKIGQTLAFDTNNILKVDVVGYTPSGGSATSLGTSFSFPNGAVGTGNSTYAGGDTSGTLTLLTRIASALTITSGSVNANLVSYLPAGGSNTALGASFLLPNGTVGTGTSSYAGGDTSGTTTLLSRLGQAVVFDASGNLKADLVSYTPTSGTPTLLGTSFAFPNAALSSYAGGDTSGVTSLNAKIASAITISGGKVAATVATGDGADSVTLVSRLTSTRAGYLDNLATAPPSLSSIISGVWGDTTSYGAGSQGAKLAAAGSAGDPWSTLIPGSYSSGQAGGILGAIQSALTTANIGITGVKAKTDQLTFTGSYIQAQVKALDQSVMDAIAADVLGQVIDGSITLKDAQALQVATNSGKYSVGAVNTSSHTGTVSYFRQDGATILATATVTYNATDNKTITGRTVQFFNLP